MRISDWSSDVCSSDLLVDRLDFFARHDDARRRTAEAGWRAAHSMFASHRIAKYNLERSFDEALSESYPWPTAIDSNPQEGRPSSAGRSEEHTSELQSLMRISYAVFFLTKKQYTYPN